jgi:uncharacterized protein
MRKVFVLLSIFVPFVFLAAAASAAVATVADATMKGDIAQVRSLLAHKADVNQAQLDGTTALHWAVRQERMDLVTLLIGAGANVKAANRFGVTPLLLACVNGNASTIEALLKTGLDANAVISDLGETALMMAARTGRADAVQVLLSHGADVNGRESLKGETALMWAAAEGHASMVRLLVERGADVNAHTYFQLIIDPEPPEAGLSVGGRRNASASTRNAPVTPQEEQAFKAIQRANNPDEKLALLVSFEKQYPRSRYTGNIYQDMLRIYDQKKDLPGVHSVVAKIRPRERQLNGHAAGGMTALMLAARENSLESVQILAAAGADVNSTLQDGTTALLMAIFNTNFEVANFLLTKNADPNLADKDGKAPLFAAVEMRDWYSTDTPGPAINREEALATIKALLERGADPNARLTGRPAYRGGANRMWLTLQGGTPFYRAASSDDVTLLRLLLAYGADPTIPASDGSTPLMVATGAGYIPGNTYLPPESEALEALLLCLQLNDVNAVNSTGLTALHAAAFRGWNPAVQALVANGAKIDAKDKEGRTPLVWADGLYRGGGIAPVWHVETIALLKRLSN